MHRGFTFVEVLLLVSVLGIMSVLYVVSTGDLSDVSVDTAAKKIVSDIRFAQHMATEKGINHGILFAKDVGYQVYKGYPGTYIKDPVTREDFIVNLNDFQGITISNNYQVEFDTMGKPVMGGDQYVRLSADSGAVRDVYVVDVTGAVVVDTVQAGSGCSCSLCSGTNAVK